MNINTTTMEQMRYMGVHDVLSYAVGYDDYYGLVVHEVHAPYDNSILLVDDAVRVEWFFGKDTGELERLAYACGGKATRVDSVFTSQYVYTFDDAWACDKFIKVATSM